MFPQKYLKFEESAGDPARVQILYERAITEYLYLLLCLERARASEDEISVYLDLFLTRIDGLRRRISVAGEMQVLDYAVIRDSFQRASDYLSLQLKGTDALLRLYAYWAHLELTLANDIVAARGVWESLLKISGTMLEAWQSYIKMEINKGNLSEARSIYRRFSPRLEELQMFNLQQEGKTFATAGDASEHSSKKNAREKTEINFNFVGGPISVKTTEGCEGANYEDLRKFFSDVGGVQSIRILKHRDTGKSRGLAYVDFCDDAHLDAAVAKNRQWLLKKKLSIARSDPSKSKSPKRSNSSEPSADQSSSIKQHDNEGIQLKGRNTFAVPRNVRPLGFTATKPKAIEGEDEKPKSNDEFRNMLLKK
ncbi:Squamous cell carcinoma antigen recognized by T-cells 3 [Bienertia sinuspersici]